MSHCTQYVYAVEMAGVWAENAGKTGRKLPRGATGLTDGTDTRVENKLMQREMQRVPERKSAPR